MELEVSKLGNRKLALKLALKSGCWQGLKIGHRTGQMGRRRQGPLPSQAMEWNLGKNFKLSKISKMAPILSKNSSTTVLL